jgi:hypothetical protein
VPEATGYLPGNGAPPVRCGWSGPRRTNREPLDGKRRGAGGMACLLQLRTRRGSLRKGERIVWRGVRWRTLEAGVGMPLKQTLAGKLISGELHPVEIAQNRDRDRLGLEELFG